MKYCFCCNFALVGFLDLQLCPAMRGKCKFLYVCSLPNYTHNPYKWCDLLASGGRSVLYTHGMPTCFVAWLSSKDACFVPKPPSQICFSRFHRLKNQIVMVVLGLLRSQSFSFVRYGSVSWQVPHVGYCLMASCLASAFSSSVEFHNMIYSPLCK